MADKPPDRGPDSSGPSRQLVLPFKHVPRHGSFLSAESNAEARIWLSRPAEWPQGRLALWGGPGTGKTHLLHLWGRPILEGPTLHGLPPPDDLAVDRADEIPEPTALLHLLNACAEAGFHVVLAGRTPPSRWNTGLPDLDSRLRALLAVEISPPEDSLLEALLRHLLAERQVMVPPPLQDWLRLRLPRTAQAIREAAARLDTASLQAGRKVTRAIAAAVLAELDPPDLAHEPDSPVDCPP